MFTFSIMIDVFDFKFTLLFFLFVFPVQNIFLFLFSFFSEFCIFSNFVFPSIIVVIIYFFAILIVSRLLESYFISSRTYAALVMLFSFCFHSLYKVQS